MYLQMGYILFIILLFSCNSSQPKTKKFREGDLWVEGRIIDDSLIDGPANLYDENGLLVAKYGYSKGVRNGEAINFYPNGKRESSFQFINGKEHGYYYSYDTLERLTSVTNYYYGLKLGDATLYESNKIISYNFFDLERNFNVFSCDYDSTGTLNSATNFDTHATLSKLTVDGKKVLGFFSYLPKPPNLMVEHKFGLIDDFGLTKGVVLVTSKEPFLDTIVSYPDSNWHYFISTQLKDSGSYNKIFVQHIKL